MSRGLGDVYKRQVWNNGIIEAQTIEKMETEIKKAPRANLYETEVREFKNFLSILKSK